jgi:hypothetical protein
METLLGKGYKNETALDFLGESLALKVSLK